MKTFQYKFMVTLQNKQVILCYDLDIKNEIKMKIMTKIVIFQKYMSKMTFKSIEIQINQNQTY